jgi:glyceraldehyde 3-phosphate dehydrogenase
MHDNAALLCNLFELFELFECRLSELAKYFIAYKGIPVNNDPLNQQKKSCLEQWQSREALAESMIPLIGQLYRSKNVVTSLYGRPLVNRSVIDIIKAHRFARQIQETELKVEDTYPILLALVDLPLGASRIDIGKLAVKFARETTATEKNSQASIDAFVKREVQDALQANQTTESFKPQDIVLYGFGRIGRLLTRILIEKTGGGEALRLKAIVVRKNEEKDIYKRASLLRRDSVHGQFQGTITVDNENQALIVNGNYIQVIYAASPAEVDYTKYGIADAIVVDNTGNWRDEAGLSKHLECPGASRVLLTAPGKGAIKNIVQGVNQQTVTSDDRIVSAASCTTNAIVPVLKLIHEKYGVVNGHMETVHAYTNDQNLIDNYHKGTRRGRSAALNMVITETGAAEAVAKVLPDLKGKLTGNAIRVPIPNVSMAIMNLTLKQAVTKEAINDFLRHASLDSSLRKQIDYVSSTEVVSSDFIGSRRASIIDAQSTIAADNRCVLYVWYDNEFGYSCQVVRLLQTMAGITYPAFPKQ